MWERGKEEGLSGIKIADMKFLEEVKENYDAVISDKVSLTLKQVDDLKRMMIEKSDEFLKKVK